MARLAVVTPNKRILPLATCGNSAGRVSMTMSIWPPSKSVMAGPLPRYGTCMSRVPVTTWNSSPAMCCEVPGPAEPKVMVPGLLLASAINSCTLLAGTLLLTATAIGMLVAMDTPTKAVAKS
ncbi:hypothetical protein D3C87_1455970 [compost metagenome]